MGSQRIGHDWVTERQQTTTGSTRSHLPPLRSVSGWLKRADPIPVWPTNLAAWSTHHTWNKDICSLCKLQKLTSVRNYYPSPSLQCGLFFALNCFESKKKAKKLKWNLCSSSLPQHITVFSFSMWWGTWRGCKVRSPSTQSCKSNFKFTTSSSRITSLLLRCILFALCILIWSHGNQTLVQQPLWEVRLPSKSWMCRRWKKRNERVLGL